MPDEPAPEDSGEVHRPWGHYKVMNRGSGLLVKRLTIWPASKISLQFHLQRSEHWTIVAGTALVTRGPDETVLQKGEPTHVPELTIHRLENIGDTPLEVIEIQCGTYLAKDDIVRLGDTYGLRYPLNDLPGQILVYPTLAAVVFDYLSSFDHIVRCQRGICIGQARSNGRYDLFCGKAVVMTALANRRKNLH